MKLLKPVSCQREPGGGNVNTLAAPGDALVGMFSDRGSTPLASTNTVQLSPEEPSILLVVLLFLLPGKISTSFYVSSLRFMFYTCLFRGSVPPDFEITC